MMTEAGYKTESPRELVERLKKQALSDIQGAKIGISRHGDEYVVIGWNYSPVHPGTEYKYVIGAKFCSINQTGLHVFGHLYPDTFRDESTAEEIAATLQMSNGAGPLEFAAITALSYFQEVIAQKKALLATYGELEANNYQLKAE